MTICYACISTKDWGIQIKGSGSNIYLVSFNERHKFKHRKKDFSCTCPSYRYHFGYCKHIKYVIENYYCGWSETKSPEPLTSREYKCPRCGNDTYSYIPNDDF